MDSTDVIKVTIPNTQIQDALKTAYSMTGADSLGDALQMLSLRLDPSRMRVDKTQRGIVDALALLNTLKLRASGIDLDRAYSKVVKSNTTKPGK